MNDLSWLLYLANVLPNLGVTLIIISFLGMLLFVVFYVCFVFDNNWNQKEEEKKQRKSDIRKSLIGLTFFTLLFIITSFIPNRDTIYYIAASEIGETAVTSERGERLLSDLETILEIQIEKLKGNV